MKYCVLIGKWNNKVKSKKNEWNCRKQIEGKKAFRLIEKTTFFVMRDDSHIEGKPTALSHLNKLER